MAKGLLVLTAVIPEDEYLSEAVDLSEGNVVGIVAPESWTPASVTFQISPDGVEFFDIYHGNSEMGVNVPRSPLTAHVVDPATLRSAMFLKLRSGLSSAPVAQEEDREFKVIVEIDGTSTRAKPRRQPVKKRRKKR